MTGFVTGKTRARTISLTSSVISSASNPISPPEPIILLGDMCCSLAAHEAQGYSGKPTEAQEGPGRPMEDQGTSGSIRQTGTAHGRPKSMWRSRLAQLFALNTHMHKIMPANFRPYVVLPGNAHPLPFSPARCTLGPVNARMHSSMLALARQIPLPDRYRLGRMTQHNIHR